MNDIKEFRSIISSLDIKSRLNLCESMSRRRVARNRPIPNHEINGKLEPYNHELELIALNSVVTGNTKKNNNINTIYWLKKSTRFLRDQRFLLENPNLDDAKLLISALSYNQLNSQIDFEQLYYRYNFMYNFCNEKINMKSIFFDSFGIYYEDLRMVTYIAFVWSIIDPSITFDMYRSKLNSKFISDLEIITVHIDSFREEYTKITTDDPYLSFLALNLLEKYPILVHDKVFYLPYVPHLILATTKSLMFRLTIGNDALRTIIGKEVFESYIRHLLDHSENSNKHKIIEEFSYKKGKLSSDFILESTNMVLFIEAKFINSGLKLRKFNKEDINNLNDKLSDHIFQVFSNIINYKKGYMSKKVKSGLKPIGLIVTYDEIYFFKDKIYELAVEKLNLKYDDKYDLDVIKREVFIMPLSSFESILRESNEDLIDLMNYYVSQEKSYLNIIYTPRTYSSKNLIDDYDDYIKTIVEIDESAIKKYLVEKEKRIKTSNRSHNPNYIILRAI